MNDPTVTGEDLATTIKRPKVISDYRSGYVPPFKVSRLVENMLASVPEKYLNGLAEVVLTNTAGLPRKLRRRVTKSRGRKVRKAAAFGLYHPTWNNRPPWIEIYVDNTLANWKWFLLLPFVRRIVVADVLFHEIGHHIHFTMRPEHREREDVADEWKRKLSNNYFKTRLPWFVNAIRLFRPFLRWFNRQNSESLYRKGLMTRKQFERSLETWEGRKDS